MIGRKPLYVMNKGIAHSRGSAVARRADMRTVLLPPNPSLSKRRALARSLAASYTRRALGNAAALALAEGVALTVSLLIASALRQAVTGGAEGVVGYGWAVIPLYFLVTASVKLLPGWGLGAVEEFRRVVLSVGGVFGLTMVGLWLLDANATGGMASSRLTLGTAGLVAVVLVPFLRWRAKTLLVNGDRWGVPAAVYGAGVAGAHIVRRLQEERGIGYTPVAVFDDDPEEWGGYLDTVPIVGDTGQVVPEAAVAFLALPDLDREHQLHLLEGPLSCYRTVVIVPDLADMPSLWATARDFGGILGLELTSTLTRPLPRLGKRAVDLAVVVGLAPLWGPLVLVLAAVVWLEDRASPFFGQERIGEDGRTFRAWKLRTMVPDADAVLQRALDADPVLRDEWEQFYKLEKDPRITRVGHVLRRTSLDELPQLYNVLTGKMSLVGPRPLPRYHHEDLPERVRQLRERVRPGITGLWQVSGRSDTGTAGMERWDPYYVRNWSPWLDAVILVRTFRVVVRGSGAY